MPPKSQKEKVIMRAKIKADTMSAMKNHDQARVDALRFLTSLLDKRELQLPPGQMTEAEVIAVLRKELKNKEESREMFAKAGREDLVSGLDFEIAVLKEYLPAEMSDEELNKIVEEAVTESGANFGAVMKTVMTKVAGRVGGEKIAPLVKNKINEQG